jgi:D-alanine-D-alanine ligase
MNVAVLFGGISPERVVSINGGKAVCKAIKELGYRVFPIDPAYGAEGLIKGEEIINNPDISEYADYKHFNTRKILECINSEIFDNIDFAFLVLHGLNGEDGTIQSVLELRGIKYSHSKVKASSCAIDKNASKLIFTAAGIPTPPWMAIGPKDYNNEKLFYAAVKELGKKLVVKPNDQGSTIGITIVESGVIEDIVSAVKTASEYSKIVLIEQFIEGREITVPVLGETSLPVIEIIPEDGFYDFEHKYTKGRTVYECPADISEDIANFTKDLALTAHDAIGCSGVTRSDFRLDEDGTAYLMEINTIPGFTETSLVPMAAKEIGIDFTELCKQIIDMGLETN